MTVGEKLAEKMGEKRTRKKIALISCFPLHPIDVFSHMGRTPVIQNETWLASCTIRKNLQIFGSPKILL